MPSSATSSSNWDFTPVINLLRSPTYSSGDRSIPARHNDSHQAPSTPGTVAAQGLNDSAPDLKHESGGPPKLGDFSSLWDFLGNTTPPVGAEAGLRQATKESIVEQPPQQPKRIQILKRPSHGDTNVDSPDKTLPRTPPRPIPTSDVSKSHKTTVEYRTTKHRNQTKQPTYEPHLSEGTVEAESDNPSIFDSSYSKRRVVSFVPSQVGIAEALSESSETPPSSFDEADGALAPIAIQNLPGGAIRVQPVAYKSAADRKVGLLTKLLKNFPDYAETITRVGRAGKSKPGSSPTCRPIHVFVDMSNVSYLSRKCRSTSADYRYWPDHGWVSRFHESIPKHPCENTDSPLATLIPELLIDLRAWSANGQEGLGGLRPLRCDRRRRETRLRDEHSRPSA